MLADPDATLRRHAAGGPDGAGDEAAALQFEGDPLVGADTTAMEAGRFRFIRGRAGVDDLGVRTVAFRADHGAVARAASQGHS
jgi:hypothetical protein